MATPTTASPRCKRVWKPSSVTMRFEPGRTDSALLVIEWDGTWARALERG
jgi:hypothetical protein